MSAESPRHVRSGGPLIVPSQPPSDRGIIDAVSGFINDVTLSSSSTVDPKDVIQWARFETADINEPTPEGDSENDVSPLLLILGYGSGVQVWLIPPSGEAQEVLSWRQGTVRVLRILPTPQHGDCFASKRPLIALCDSAGPGPSFCSLSFISIRGGEQVKSIKFKNPILDVLANKRSVVVSFSERFAVFDAATLEDRMAVTTCYPCPCPLGGSLPINPLSLGERWLAYADKKLHQSKRSSGGCEGEGVTSYTATVLHAAKSLSKGLRGLGETVAHSLAGGRSTSQSPSPPNSDIQQPGIVTIIDIEGTDEEDGQDADEPSDPIIAHFVAHSDAIIALKFDASGLLLVTADRRGHDFHVFRVNPHPCGPSLASVHHLYILHRGDTTAKVQDIAISSDSRWAAISTLRGTTHVFAVSAYGGACGVRTHTQPRVVNRLSRFHRSAGLPIHAAASKRPLGSATASPVGEGLSHGAWFPNPRLPPYPLPHTTTPLAQLRPTANIPTHTITRTSSGRQRLSSVSEDSNAVPLLARARFGAAAGGGLAAGGLARGPPAPVAALYLMAANGSLLHLLLHPRPLASIPKEKICDESPIELEVEPVAQWPLQRAAAAADLLAPLPASSPLLQACARRAAGYCGEASLSSEERWLSQVEIVTHAGPHRRLWMGPQFLFKTYNCTGSSSSLSEAEAVEVETSAVARSNPVNMPGALPMPILVDSGSASSLEHSPSDSFRRKSLLAESGRAASVCDVQLKEDLAEAMKEDHGVARSEGYPPAEAAGAGVSRAVGPRGTVVQPSSAPAAPPASAPDPPASSNCDEATFRPVLRAPAALPARPEPAARALPTTTTIPARSVRPRPADLTPPDPLPLTTMRVIPAALTSTPIERYVPDDECMTTDVRASEGGREREREREREKPPELSPIDDSNKVKSSPTPLDGGQADASYKDRKSRVKPSRENDVTKLKVCERKETEVVKVESIKIVEPVEKPIVVVPLKEKPSELSKGKLSRDKTPVSLKCSVKETTENKAKIEVKLEEQAWDMLLNEPEKPIVCSAQPVVNDKSIEEAKPKPKKNRKGKKSQDEAQARAEEDTFIEIHAIDEKQQPSSDLVSISMPYEDIEPISYSAKAKKSRASSSVTPERINNTVPREQSCVVSENKDKISIGVDRKDNSFSSEVKENYCNLESKPQSKVIAEDKGQCSDAFETIDEFNGNERNDHFDDDDIWTLDESEPIKPTETCETSDIKSKVVPEYEIKSKEVGIDKLNIDTLKVSYDTVETTKEFTKTKKSKSPSPYYERKSDKRYETDVKDVYVIETMKEEFPEIQITKGMRKKSPQPPKRMQEKELVTDKPVQSVENPIESVVNTVMPVENPVKPVENPSKPFENPAKPLKNLVKPVEYPVKPVEVNPVKPDVKTTKSAVKPVKSIEKSVKPIDINTDKTVEKAIKPVKSIETPVKPIDTTPVEHVEKAIKPSVKPDKSIENTIKPVEINLVKPIDKPKKPFVTKLDEMPFKPFKPVENPVQYVERPVKSWSSIAASKNAKKDDKVIEKHESFKEIDAVEKRSEICDEESSTKVSLQQKLFELCKRTDIMVAECDAPSDLTYVPNLPHLEPLEFGLEDFKLEAMQDSLLDLNDTSPICKINIDSILSTIKGTTSKAIESSAFNLIDLEKFPTKYERGFSVIENEEIKTQEVKIDDEDAAKDAEVMEKSSDDDITSPVVTTDSDKEEKKGASNVTMPSSKQSKSKKSRKKKK